jgi:hypothetical protein
MLPLFEKLKTVWLSRMNFYNHSVGFIQHMKECKKSLNCHRAVSSSRFFHLLHLVSQTAFNPVLSLAYAVTVLIGAVLFIILPSAALWNQNAMVNAIMKQRQVVTL